MIETYSDFASIGKDWEELYDSCECTPFQSLEYNKIAFKYEFENFGSTLYILCYKNAYNEIEGIFPTCLKNGELKFINDRGTDYCEPLIDLKANNHHIFSEIANHILADKNIKTVRLDNIRSASPLLSYLKTYLKEASIFNINAYSYLICKPTDNIFDNFVNLNSEKIKKLKKIKSKSQIYDLNIYRASSQSFPLQKLKYLSQYMENHGLRTKESYPASFWTFVQQCYETGILEIALLEKEHIPVSAGMIFSNNDMSVRWVILYTDSKYNLWNNFRYIIQKSQNLDKHFEINFGRGVYDYKIKNFKPELGLLYSFNYSKTVSGQTKILLKMAKTYLRPIAKRILK